jgi:hypothetical protein
VLAAHAVGVEILRLALLGDHAASP